MRRITVVGMIILSLVAMPLVVGARAGDKPAKMTVCHIPDSGEPHEIVISERALTAHQDHGDLEGDCPDLASLPPANTPPVADIAVIEVIPCNFFGCSSLWLDGSGSFDDEGDAMTFDWSVSDSFGLETTSSEASFGMSGPPGDYAISLTVSDGELTNTATTTFTP